MEVCWGKDLDAALVWGSGGGAHYSSSPSESESFAGSIQAE